MTLKICVIEDEMIYHEQLQNVIKKCEQQNHLKIDADYFTTYSSKTLKTANDYHLFILDIQLREQNGMDIAKQLRQEKYEGSILFLTAYHDYVYDGYHVNALDYLLKPLNSDKFNDCILRIAKRLERQCLTFRSKHTFIKVPYRDILYITSRNQYVEVITTNEHFMMNESLKNITNHLPLYFVQCHRTTIVNLDYVEKIIKPDVFLSDGTVLPVSRKYSEALKDAFLNHLQ